MYTSTCTVALHAVYTSYHRPHFFIPYNAVFFAQGTVTLPRSLHCLSVLFFMYHCLNAFITCTLHFLVFPWGIHSLPVCLISCSGAWPTGVKWLHVWYSPPRYDCLDVLALCLVAAFHSLCIASTNGLSFYWQFVLAAPLAACCTCISTLCLDVFVAFAWCSVCHCLDVCLACLSCVVFYAPLAGCVWCLRAPWPVYTGYWSAVLYAVCLNVFVACMLQHP